MGKRRKTSNPNLAAQNDEQGTADRTTITVKPPRRAKKEPKQSECIDVLQTRASFGNEKSSTQSQTPTTVKDSDAEGKTIKKPRAPKRRRLPQPPSGVTLKDAPVGIRKNMAIKSSPKRRANIRKLPQPESDKNNRKTEDVDAQNAKSNGVAASRERTLPQPPNNQTTFGKRVASSAGQVVKRQRHWTRKHLYRLAKAGRTLLTKAPRCCITKQVSLSDLNKEQTTERRASDSFDGPAKSAKYKVATSVARSSSDEDEEAIKIKRREEFLRSATVDHGEQPKTKQKRKRKKAVSKKEVSEEHPEISITRKDTISSTCQPGQQVELTVEHCESKGEKGRHPMTEETDTVSAEEKFKQGTSVLEDQKLITESPIKENVRSPRQRRRKKPVAMIESEGTARRSPVESTKDKHVANVDNSPNETTESALSESPTRNTIGSPRSHKTSSKYHIQQPHAETDNHEDVSEGETNPNNSTSVAISQDEKNNMSRRCGRHKKSKIIESDQIQLRAETVKEENAAEGDTEPAATILSGGRRKVVEELPIEMQRSSIQRRRKASATMIVPDNHIQKPVTEAAKRNVAMNESRSTEATLESQIKNPRSPKRSWRKKSETMVGSEGHKQPLTETTNEEKVTFRGTRSTETIPGANNRRAVGEPPIINPRRSPKQRRRKKSGTTVGSEVHKQQLTETTSEEVTIRATEPTETTPDAGNGKAVAEPAIINPKRSPKQRRCKKSGIMVGSEDHKQLQTETTKEKETIRATEPTETTPDAANRKAIAEPPMINPKRSPKQRRCKKSEIMVGSEDHKQPLRETTKEKVTIRATEPTETNPGADNRKTVTEQPIINPRKSPKQRRRKTLGTMVRSEGHKQPLTETTKEKVTVRETEPTETTPDADNRKIVSEQPIKTPRSPKQRRRKKSGTMVVCEDHKQPLTEAMNEENVTNGETGPTETTIDADYRTVAEPPIQKPRRSPKQRRRKMSGTMVGSEGNKRPLTETTKEEKVIVREIEPTETSPDADNRQTVAEPPIKPPSSPKQRRRKKSETMVVSEDNKQPLTETMNEENVTIGETGPTETTLDADHRTVAEPPIQNPRSPPKQRRRKKSETMLGSEGHKQRLTETTEEDKVTVRETGPTETSPDADNRQTGAEPPIKPPRSSKQRRRKKSGIMVVSEDHKQPLTETTQEENVTIRETGQTGTTLDVDHGTVAEPPIQHPRRSPKQRRPKKSEDHRQHPLTETMEEECVTKKQTESTEGKSPDTKTSWFARHRRYHRSQAAISSKDQVEQLREASKERNVAEGDNVPIETTPNRDHKKSYIKKTSKSSKQQRRKQTQAAISSEDHVHQPRTETSEDNNAHNRSFAQKKTNVTGENDNDLHKTSYPKESLDRTSSATALPTKLVLSSEQDLGEKHKRKLDGEIPQTQCTDSSSDKKGSVATKMSGVCTSELECMHSEKDKQRGTAKQDKADFCDQKTTGGNITNLEASPTKPPRRRRKSNKSNDTHTNDHVGRETIAVTQNSNASEMSPGTRHRRKKKHPTQCPKGAVKQQGVEVTCPRESSFGAKELGTAQVIFEKERLTKDVAYMYLETSDTVTDPTDLKPTEFLTESRHLADMASINSWDSSSQDETEPKASQRDCAEKLKLGIREDNISRVSHITNSHAETSSCNSHPAVNRKEKYQETSEQNTTSQIDEDKKGPKENIRITIPRNDKLSTKAESPESSENSFSETWKDLVNEIAPREAPTFQTDISSQHERVIKNAKKQDNSHHQTKASLLSMNDACEGSFDSCDESVLKARLDMPKAVSSKNSFIKTKPCNIGQQMLQTRSQTENKTVVRNQKNAEDSSLPTEPGTSSTLENCQFYGDDNGNDGSMSLEDIVDLELAQMETAKPESSVNAKTINPADNTQPAFDCITHTDDMSISKLVDLELAKLDAPREEDLTNDELADNSWDDSFSETWKNLVDEIAPRKRQLSKHVPRSASAVQTIQCCTVESRASIPKKQNKKEDSESDSWDDSCVQQIAPKKPKAISGKKGLHNQGESNRTDMSQREKTAREFEDATRNDAPNDICSEQIPNSRRETLAKKVVKAPEVQQSDNVIVSNSDSMDDIASLASFDELNNFAKTNPSVDCVPSVSKSSSRECRNDTISSPVVESAKQVPSSSIVQEDSVGEVTRLSERTKIGILAAENTSSADRASFLEDQENVTTGKSLLKVKQLSSEEEDSVISWGPLDNKGKSVSNTTIRTIGVLPIKGQSIDNTSKTSSPYIAKQTSSHETVTVMSQGRTDEKKTGKGKGHQPKIGPMDRSSYLAALGEKNETNMETNSHEIQGENNEIVKQNEMPIPSVKKKKSIFRWKKRGKSLFKSAPKVGKKDHKAKNKFQEPIIVDQSASSPQGIQGTEDIDDEPDSESKPEGPLITKKESCSRVKEKEENELCTEDNTGLLRSDKLSASISSSWTPPIIAKENPFLADEPGLFEKNRKPGRAKRIFSKLKHHKKKVKVTQVKDIRNLLMQDSESEESLGKDIKKARKKRMARAQKMSGIFARSKSLTERTDGKKAKSVRRFSGCTILVRPSQDSDEDQWDEKESHKGLKRNFQPSNKPSVTGERKKKSGRRIKRALRLFARSRVQNSPDLFNEDKQQEHVRNTESQKEGKAPTSSSLIAVLSEIEKELPDISDSLIVDKEQDNETREQLSKKEIKALKKKEKKEAKARRKKEKKELKEQKSKAPTSLSVTDSPSEVSVHKQIRESNGAVKGKGPILVREAEPQKEGKDSTSSSLIAVLSEIEKDLPDISDSLIVDKEKDNETHEKLSKKEMKALKKKEKKEAKARRKKEKKELKKQDSKAPTPCSVTDALSEIQDGIHTVNVGKEPEREMQEQLSKKEMKARKKQEKKEAKARKKKEKEECKKQGSTAPTPSSVSVTDAPSEISIEKQTQDSNDTVNVGKEPERETPQQVSKEEVKALKKKEKKEAKAWEKEEKNEFKEQESKAPTSSFVTDAPSEISVQKQVEDSNGTVNVDKEPENDAQEQLSQKEIKAMKKKEKKEAKAQKKEEKKEAKARKEEEKKEAKARKEDEKKEAKARKEEEKKELKTEHSSTPAPSSVADASSKTSIETQERKEKVKAAKKIGTLFRSLTHSKAKDPDHGHDEEQEKCEKGSHDHKKKTKKGSKSPQEEPERPDTNKTPPELETATSDKTPSLSDNGEGQQTPNISKAKIRDTLRSIKRISSDVTIGEDEQLESVPEKKSSKPKLAKYKRSAVTDAYYSLQHELDGLAGKVRRNRINLRNKWRDFKAERADKKK